MHIERLFATILKFVRLVKPHICPKLECSLSLIPAVEGRKSLQSDRGLLVVSLSGVQIPLSTTLPPNAASTDFPHRPFAGVTRRDLLKTATSQRESPPEAYDVHRRIRTPGMAPCGTRPENEFGGGATEPGPC